MAEHETSRSSTTDGLPVSPSLGPALESLEFPRHTNLVDRRVVLLSAISIVIGALAALAAQVLIHLIGLITNIAFYQRLSFEPVLPAGADLGPWVIAVPVVGGLIVGVMARYGSAAIRGHGIPETMEKVLTGQSRIPARLTLLKPLSAAVSIGTGGPFGAEGPIIATGGSLGSLAGQVVHVSAAERKTLLAGGAAAGMAATFGAPVSAVLLAVELLLFEYRPRSLVPVVFASVTAAGIRIVFEGAEPIFEMPGIEAAAGGAMAWYTLVGAIAGVCAVYVTRAVYAIEDGFERLPIHWMWWPAIGAVAVGVVGYFAPRTMGVGYDVIADITGAQLTLGTIGFLCVMKFISWSVALGSGTSGGTLAPLFTIGGGLGALVGAAGIWLFPGAGIDARVAALVGMAAIFAGSSWALLASVVFAFETTLQPMGLLPLLAGCAAAFLVSCLMMRQSIMTEKIARRGVMVPAEYLADPLDHVRVHEVASRPVTTIRVDETLERVRAWIRAGGPEASHQGFPLVNDQGVLVGVLTRRNLLDEAEPGERRAGELLRRPPVVVYDDTTLRQAADHMVRHDLGRLPVMSREDPGQVVGIITRSDILSGYRRRIDETTRGAKREKERGATNGSGNGNGEGNER